MVKNGSDSNKLKPGDIKPGNILRHYGQSKIPTYLLVVEPDEFKEKSSPKMFKPGTLDAILEKKESIFSEEESITDPQRGIIFVRNGNGNYFIAHYTQFTREDIITSPRDEKVLAERVYREEVRKLEDKGIGNLLLLQEAANYNSA